MLTEEIYNLMNSLAQCQGIHKVCLYDEQGTFLADDTQKTLSPEMREYGLNQLKTLIKLSAKFKIDNEEICYQLDETKVCFNFFSNACLIVFGKHDAFDVSAKLIINNLAVEIDRRFMSSEKNKKRSHSRSTSIDKESLPGIVEDEHGFVVFLKKLLNKYGSPQATSEVVRYIAGKNLTEETMDSHKAYNLISYLSSFVEDENKDLFTTESEEALKQFF